MNAMLTDSFHKHLRMDTQTSSSKTLVKQEILDVCHKIKQHTIPDIPVH